MKEEGKRNEATNDRKVSGEEKYEGGKNIVQKEGKTALLRREQILDLNRNFNGESGV